jgi:Transposase domain (DUF772)/Transposase DDE domain
MTILPYILTDFIEQHLGILEQWFNERIYEHLVKQARRHELVRMKAKFDFSPIEECCRGYQHEEGPGAKAQYTIGQYVRALMVKYIYGWSYRQTEERIRHDLVVKWFVGYGVLDEVLDHSALCLFEQWVDREQHRAFFDQTLNQIDQDFPQEAQAVQIGDTFGMWANAAQESLVKLLRHTSRLLLGELEKGAGERYQAIIGQLDRQLLFGLTDEVQVYWMSKEERQLQRENTGRGAWHLLQLVKPELDELEEPLRARVQLRVEDLAKILQDEYHLTCNAEGKLEQIVELDKEHKGEYRLCSATDRDATCRNHGGQQIVGYNVSLAATPHGLIREIAAATGAEPDQAGIADLIEVQYQNRGMCPEKLIYDQAGGRGRTRAEVARVSHQQTQLVARIPPSTVNSGRFGPDAFHLTETGDLICPQQRTNSCRYLSGARDATIFEFSAKRCSGCPLWAQCRDPKASPGGARRVFISDYQDEIRQAQAYNQTALFKKEMKLRPLIERVIFMLTFYDGGRRARNRGRSRVDFQVKMSATGRNIRTWLKFWDQKERLGCATIG